jgi:hypothetical protein
LDNVAIKNFAILLVTNSLKRVREIFPKFLTLHAFQGTNYVRILDFFILVENLLFLAH